MNDRSLRAKAARRALRTMFSAPPPLLRALVGPLPRNDRGHELDLPTRAFLRTVAGAREPIGARGLEAMRFEMDFRAPWADFERHDVHVSERAIPGDRGHAIGIRVYTPAGGDGARPICIYFHGGGFVIGSVRSHDGLCSRIAQRTDSVVVSVDYRLAPEHRFPAAAHDAIAAFRWVSANARELGGDASRIALAGDSAGGNLAAVTAWHERAAAIPPRFQLLVYPVTDYVHAYESRRLYSRGFLHDEEAIHWFRGHYFGDAEADRDHPLASVIRAPDLRGVAPAHIVTAGFDPLRDDGERYAARLAEQGVPVTHVCEEPLVHGFFSLGGILPSARAAIDRAIAALATGIRGGGRLDPATP